MMKRLFMVCLAACMGVLPLLAQEIVSDTVATGIENGVATHDIRGVVVDKKGRPIVGASVSVQNNKKKRTGLVAWKKREEVNISTVTDVDGKFLLEDVPVTAKYIVVESVGMETETRKIDEPMSVDTKRKKLTFVVQAGVSMSRYTVNGGDFKAGYEVGVGLEVRMSKRWAFRPMVQLSQRGTVYKQEQNGMSYEETWNPTFLDIPLYFVNRHKLVRNWNLVFSFGPVVSYGFGGKVKMNFNGEQAELSVFDKEYDNGAGELHSLLHPFNFGAAYSLGVEYKQLTVGVWGKNMVLPTSCYGFTCDPCEHNWVLTFGAAYRF